MGVETQVKWRAAEALYWVAPTQADRDPLLRLNGDADGVINHLSFLSTVNPACAPAGWDLVMTGIRPGLEMGLGELEKQTRIQLRDWLGGETEDWRLLRHSLIREALPSRAHLSKSAIQPLRKGVWNCGDYTSSPSIQGAMESGRKVADAVLASRQGAGSLGDR